MSLITLSDLTLSIHGHPILRDVDIEIREGEIFGLVGESGSGKSMTALAIMGLLPHGSETTGQIRFEGANLLTRPEGAMCALRGARIGMIFQEPMTALNPLMTIGDQVAETLRLHTGMGRGEALTIAREKLDRVGLPEPRFPLSLYPHELSGGQRQRVAIALAIVLRPALLIADEPTTALDVTTQAEVLDLLESLVDEEGMACLLITHDLAVIADRAARVAVMKSGEVVETGQTQAIFRAQNHPYTQALFAASSHVPDAPDVPPPDPVPILQVEEAVRIYRTPRPSPFAPPGELRAVDGVSLTIRNGESLGLVGESGCGKSTLTRAILGLDPLQGGRILLDGEPVEAGRKMPPAMRAKIQVVFQDPYGSFNPRWRVDHLVAEPFHLTGRPADWRDRVAEALAEVGLNPDGRDKFIHEFSGGQRQRIAIARALIIRPELIVLDEAVSALDVRVRAQVLDLLARLRETHGLSYLFISHDLTVVRAVTDRVLVMQAGKIVETGPTEQVLTAPQTDYARRLVAAAPEIPPEWRAP